MVLLILELLSGKNKQVVIEERQRPFNIKKRAVHGKGDI